MGLGLYVWLRMKRGALLLLAGFLYGSVVHGLYDGILFSRMGSWGLVLEFLLIGGMVRAVMSLLEYTTAISPARCSLKAFALHSDDAHLADGLQCLHCRSTNPKVEYRLGAIRFQKCDNCACYVTTKRGLRRIFRHFGSRFRNRQGEYFKASATGAPFSTLYRDNYISDQENLAYFYIEPLSEALEELNVARIQSMQDHWWFPELQKTDGGDLRRRRRRHAQGDDRMET